LVPFGLMVDWGNPDLIAANKYYDILGYHMYSTYEYLDDLVQFKERNPLIPNLNWASDMMRNWISSTIDAVFFGTLLVCIAGITSLYGERGRGPLQEKAVGLFRRGIDV